MRWLALSLLIANLLYLGWELDRDARALVANTPEPMKLPAHTATLEIIDETASVQELKPVYGWQLPRSALLPSE